MKIALVLTPCWLPENPPENIASLASFIKQAKHSVKCYDLNIRFYNLLKKSHINFNKEDEISINSWQNNLNKIWEDQIVLSKLFIEYDDEINSYIQDIVSWNPDVIGFTIYSISLLFSAEIAERIKLINPSIRIVFGGPSCFPHYRGKTIFTYSKAVDYVCYGEGEMAIVELINNLECKNESSSVKGFYSRLEDGSIIDGGEIEMIKNLDTLPFADYSDFNLIEYTSTTLPINTSRGCINRCSFCNESPFWKKFRSRSAISVFNEIQELKLKYPSFNSIWFVDSLINGNINFLETLADVLIESNLKIRWTASAYISEKLNFRIFWKLKKSGCESLLFGLESGSNDVLKSMNKGYSVEIAKKVLKDCAKSGIQTYTNIIVGHPNETYHNYLETVRLLLFFLNQNNVKNSTFNICYVLNGSTLKNKMDKFDINYGFIDSWYSFDKQNNKEIRELRLNAILKVSDFSHYNDERKISSSIFKIFRTTLPFSFIHYCVFFKLILKYKSKRVVNKFKAEYEVYFKNHKNIANDDTKDGNYISAIVNYKIEFFVQKILIHIHGKDFANQKQVEFLKYKTIFIELLKFFDKNDREMVLDVMFPLSAKQLTYYFANIDFSKMNLLVTIMKEQLKSPFNI